MEVRQMSVQDWLDIFAMRPMTLDQVDTIEDRRNAGKQLATWERNCLRAYRRLQQQRAA